VLRLMRQPRYVMTWLVVVVVAFTCFSLGIWQWHRLHWKHAENVALRANNSDPYSPVEAVLPDTTAAESQQTSKIDEFRQVTATGVYDASRQLLLREQSLDSNVGFYVVTPLRLADQTTVLIVRGFIQADGSATTSPKIPEPPAGAVTVKGRVEPGDTGDDHYGQVPAGQIDKINPTQAAARIDGPVLSGYLELEDGQPGGKGLTALPAPDMSNPAGGAVEPQHLAYVIQWFLFGLMALALPFVLVRADLKQTAARTGAEVPSMLPGPLRRKRSLMYSPPSRTVAELEAAPGSEGAELARRSAASTELARVEAAAERARIVAKLSDRYGR
jgi:cytochrome oxidase assembly protein ShyY1